MGFLEMLVIATIIIAAAYVGYHEWQESMTVPDDHGSGVEPHLTITNTYNILNQSIIIQILR